MNCNYQVMKVSQPISRVLSRAIIHLWPASPQTFSSLPESNASNIVRFLFGLTPSGVYLATSCYQLRGALLPHHFTLTHRRLKSDQGGIFSVALAVGSHPPGVTWHPALRSPDFPLPDHLIARGISNKLLLKTCNRVVRQQLSS